ncbi:MAG: DUF5658 family protein [Dehalococcoidales bacterium]|nr:DUF5658 family protein [Dehalococcoidales bacterium]
MNYRYERLLRDANPTHDIPLKVGYLFLQQADLLLTLAAVSAGFSELNPFMANLIHTPVDLLLFKLVLPVLLVLLVPGKWFLPAIVLLTLVVGWNIKELLLVLI